MSLCYNPLTKGKTLQVIKQFIKLEANVGAELKPLKKINEIIHLFHSIEDSEKQVAVYTSFIWQLKIDNNQK